jgi:hypothetical protein
MCWISSIGLDRQIVESECGVEKGERVEMFPKAYRVLELLFLSGVQDTSFILT